MQSVCPETGTLGGLYLSISKDESASQVTVATSQIKHLQFSSLYSSY